MAPEFTRISKTILAITGVVYLMDSFFLEIVYDVASYMKKQAKYFGLKKNKANKKQK